MPGFADCKGKYYKITYQHTLTYTHTKRKSKVIEDNISQEKTGGAQILSHIFFIKNM